jgi:hypothetical protein
MRTSLLCTVVAILLVVPAAGQTYVDADATGAGDGSSWRNAYPTLQEALANTPSGEIWVAEGTYYPDEGPSATPDDRTESFVVTNGVTVRGRFEGTESNPDERVLDRGVNPTILSGEIQQDDDSTNNAYHVLDQSGGVVEAVRITQGSATGAGPQGRGGGATLSGGELRRSFLQGNRARRGAAAYVTGSPELRRVLINDNHAPRTGALYLDGDAATLNNLTVADNTVGSPDGVNGLHHVNSDAAVTNSAFGPETTNTVGPIVDDITATYTGDVLGEGTTLDDATVTIRNADADTLITTTQTDADGSYQATHTYPENQSYQAQIIADKDEHRADTTTVATGNTDDTYTEDFDLERRVHQLTITTDDATTNNPVNTAGAITTESDTLTTYQAGDDGETTVTIETLADQITVSANNDNYNNTTTTQSLGSNKTITTAISLAPIQYEFNASVEDTDGNPLTNVDLALTDTDNNTITTTTGDDNQATLTATINDGFQAGETGELTATKDTYQADTLNVTHDPDNPVKNKTVTLQPEPTAEPMTITVNSKVIANDLYDGGYDDTPDDITITTPDTTINADFQNQAATFTIDDTTSIDDITITHDDTTAFLDETSIYKTSEQNPIDLTLDTGDFDEFPREPHAQSNYGDNASTDDRTITLDADSLVTSYELRFIPRTTPEGNNTVDDYIPHINQGRSKRFTNQTVGDTTYTQDKLFIVEHTENNWLDKASTAYDDVRDTLPFPTSQPDTVSYDSLLTIRAERNYMNVTNIQEGSNGNAIFDGPRFIEESLAEASAGTTQRTTTSEAYSSFNGYGTTAGDEEPGDTIFDENGEFIKDEAAFPLRIQYSSFSDNDNF